MGLDDFSLLTLATFFIALAVLYRDLMTDYTALTSQTDTTLQTMAKAVAQLQVHVTALATPGTDQATVDGIVSRLKAGTDQLAAAITTAQVAVSN